MTRTFNHGMEQGLHSLSMMPSGDCFMTGDVNSINIQNVERNDVDVFKVCQRSEEDITSATFNQDTHDVFMYSTEGGKIHICDLRESSDFTNNSSLVLDTTGGGGGSRKGYVNLCNSISSVKFVGSDLRKIVSRDLLTVKVWDIRSPEKARMIHSTHVTDYLESALPYMEESQSFFCEVSPDGKNIATGGFNYNAHVIDMDGTSNLTIPCVFD